VIRQFDILLDKEWQVQAWVQTEQFEFKRPRLSFVSQMEKAQKES